MLKHAMMNFIHTQLLTSSHKRGTRSSTSSSLRNQLGSQSPVHFFPGELQLPWPGKSVAFGPMTPLTRAALVKSRSPTTALVLQRRSRSTKGKEKGARISPGGTPSVRRPTSTLNGSGEGGATMLPPLNSAFSPSTPERLQRYMLSPSLFTYLFLSYTS